MQNIPPPRLRILILKADRLCAEALHGILGHAVPAAEIDEASLLSEAGRLLSADRCDLLVAGTTMLDGETCDLLADCREGVYPMPRSVLIATGSRQPRVLRRLRSLGIRGVFDTLSETASQLVTALHHVMEGHSYWSPAAINCLHTELLPSQRVCESLSLTEQLVLSIIGDGSDDIFTAERTGLAPSTVQSVRRNLHRKFRVQQKGELMRVAAQLDYVRFTPNGVVRPGFAHLLEKWQSHRRQSLAPSS